jgi:hypothetical protein
MKGNGRQSWRIRHWRMGVKASAPTGSLNFLKVLVVRVHRVYFLGGQYTDQVAAHGATARLYAARLFPELGAPVKTQCMTLVINGRRTHVDPRLDRSFLLLAVPREQNTLKGQ